MFAPLQQSTSNGGGTTTGGGVGLDFNQLLRESRHLESAMEGVNTAYAARSLGSANGGAGSLSLAMRVPTLQRNLQQLSVASRRLARQQVPTDVATDSQAQLLLSAKGIDLRRQSRALKDMELSLPAARHAAQPTAGIESFHPLDIERFLAQQQQLLCHQAMEEAAKVTADTYRRHDLASLADDWESAKRDILDSLGFRGGKNALGGGVGGGDADVPMSGGPNGKRKSPTASLHAGPTGPVLAMEQAIYARTIQDLNRARVHRGAQAYDLISELQTASARVDEFFAAQGAPQGLAPGDVADCWEVLRFMLNGSQANGAQGEPLSEKLFAAAYSAASNSSESRALQAQLVEGARQYSQQLFEQYVRTVVAKYPDARKTPHGKPTFAQQVAAYVSILGGQLPPVSREVQLDGVPFWPQVYFAFRCGHINTALDLLHRQLGHSNGGFGAAAGGASAFGGNRSMSLGLGLGGPAGAQGHAESNRMLVEAMERRAAASEQRGGLTPTTWMALQEEYQRELATAINAAKAHGGGSAHAANYADPYKIALYHLLGRFRLPAAFELASTSVVAPTIEDHLWLKLTLLEGVDGLVIPDVIRDQVDVHATRLDALQADLLQRGESAFNPDGRHPLSYFKVLLLSQQFEQAVYYLIRTPFFSIGVHFAIALDYVGVLREHTNSAQELLIAVTTSSAATAAASSSLSGGGGQQSSSSRFAVNYSRILRKYVESFVRTHPFEAFHYLYLLHPHTPGGVMRRRQQAAIGFGSNEDHMEDALPGSSVGDSVHSDASFPAMRDLILETRDYPLLLGSIVPAGGGMGPAGGAPSEIQTSRSLVYAYYTRAEAQYLIVHTASTMEAHGLTLDAIQLFVLAYRFDLAVELLLKTLAPLVAAGMQQPERARLVELAQQVQRVVRSQQATGGDSQLMQQRQLQQRGASFFGQQVESEASSASLHALHQLLLLVNYFDLYHLGHQQYESALVVLSGEDLDLVPFHADEVVDKATKFENPTATHLALKRCISDVAVSLMDIYYAQFQMVKREMQAQHMYAASNAQRDQTKQQRILALRSQASALVSFLGRIQSSMQISSDTFAQLTSVESMMAA